MMAPGFIANFDSAAAMVRSTARSLRGQDLPGLGVIPHALLPAANALMAGANASPREFREGIYSWSGWSEAMLPSRLGRIKVEKIPQWIVSEYPRRQFPAVMIGSSNGANTHLCAALGIPWLPQTALIPVKRRGMHPDEPKDDLRWGVEPGAALLEANPEIVLHHMHDPNQDRLMAQRMAYFRVKWIRLSEAYRRFLIERLEPGGTIFIVECDLTWPSTRVQERHYFQFGALGGAEVEEFFNGGPRVENYLLRYGSHRARWEPPAPDADRAEAEWGFDERLRGEIEQFASEHGYRIQRITFKLPHDLSPLVADHYRWWNRERGVVGNRLFVESFVVHDPYWAIRTGSVPYWMFFNKEPSARDLEAYLQDTDPFDEIYLMLFSHGVESIGLAPIQRWRSLLGRARKRGEFLGVDENLYPRDFASMARYNHRIQQMIPARYPLPPSIPLDAFLAFFREHEQRYKVRIESGLGEKGIESFRDDSRLHAETAGAR